MKAKEENSDDSNDFAEEDSEDDETLIEQKAKKRDEKEKKLREASEAELKATIAEGERFKLTEEGEEEAQEEGLGDLQAVQQKIQELIGVLNNFKQQREDGISRSQYIQKVIFFI